MGVLLGCLGGRRKVCSSGEVEAFWSVTSQIVEVAVEEVGRLVG